MDDRRGRAVDREMRRKCFSGYVDRVVSGAPPFGGPSDPADVKRDALLTLLERKADSAHLDVPDYGKKNQFVLPWPKSATEKGSAASLASIRLPRARSSYEIDRRSPNVLAAASPTNDCPRSR